MRRVKILLALLLALALLGSLTAMAAGSPYTYTVRIYSGGQGLIDGREVVVYEGLQYGDRVTFSLRSVTLTDDSKYYVRGIRESGKDNNTVGVTSFPVTRDQDYVVAYGILGDAVAYTVRYVDRNGNELAPSETYYGNVGDKPVVVVWQLDKPAVPAEIEPWADALLVAFGVQHQAVLDIVSGKCEPSGLLPMQLPADMETVETQQEDVPRDMKCYKDSCGNVYDFAFGLNWSGVIRDGRVQKYL